MKKLFLLMMMAAAPLSAQSANTGKGAVLHALDKVSGKVTDIELANGTSVEYGRLVVSLGECRYRSGDAYAYLTIRESDEAEAAFQGWMIASSPALSALDHPRYDVWVARCKTK